MQPHLSPAAPPTLTRLRNDLRAAQRDWAGFAEFDGWPGGNPWAEHRDEAAARIQAIRAEIAALTAPAMGLAA